MSPSTILLFSVKRRIEGAKKRRKKERDKTKAKRKTKINSRSLVSCRCAQLDNLPTYFLPRHPSFSYCFPSCKKSSTYLYFLIAEKTIEEAEIFIMRRTSSSLYYLFWLPTLKMLRTCPLYSCTPNPKLLDSPN